MSNTKELNLKTDNIQILTDQKTCIDTRFGTIGEPCCPKYYIANSSGIRLSRNYYSIEKLDDIHYVVSDLDFMYSLGLKQWVEIHGNKFKESDIPRLQIHYGVISVVNNEVKEVVPVIYNTITLSNSGVIIVSGSDRWVHTFNNGILETNYQKEKLGCINLDPTSDYYGLNIIPLVLDSLEHFSLEYKDFSHVHIEGYDGYLSKTLDIDRYEQFIKLYTSIINGNISYSEYRKQIAKAVSKLLYSREEVMMIIEKNSENDELGFDNEPKKLIKKD